MSKPSFVVHLADLERGPRQISWTLEPHWLEHALSDTEATPLAPGELDLYLKKNGREILVQGKVRVRVSMPCARTLDPVEVNLEPEVLLLLAPAHTPPKSRPRHARPRRRDRNRQPHPAEQPKKQRQGKGDWSVDPVLTDEDAARDTYSGESIVLDGFVREHLLLELPMRPLRSDLHSDSDAAMAPPPAQAAESQVDPRLAPLAAIAQRLRQNKE